MRPKCLKFRLNFNHSTCVPGGFLGFSRQVSRLLSLYFRTVARVFDVHSHSLLPSLPSSECGSSSSVSKMDFSRSTLQVMLAVYMGPYSNRSSPLPPSSYSLVVLPRRPPLSTSLFTLSL